MTRTRNDKAYWAKTYVMGRVRIYAWERLERGGRVHMKYSSPDRHGRDRRVKQKLDGDLGVRDVRGRLDQRKIRDIDAAVHAIAAQLTLGEVPRTAVRDERPLTLTDGFRLVLDFETGKFPTRTRRWEEVKRAAGKLERILGGNRAWTEITPADARKVWRSLADAAKKVVTGDHVTGARQAEVTLDALYSTANWLRDESRIPQTACLPAIRWRQKLRDDWQAITDTVITPSRPRHTHEEMVRLFAHLHDDQVDPRFALAFDLGGEQRLGQVLRCRRSHLELPAIDRDVLRLGGAGPHLGVVRVVGSGKKRASPIALTADQRTAVEAALSGYLSLYEEAWRGGEIEDYPLFPAGRFKQGKAKLVDQPKVLSRDAARKMFRQLEAVSSVTSVKGRAWYGVRRIATDVAEDVEKDERVLNSLTGHRDSSTRRLVYQDRERPELLARAAATREKIRHGDVKPQVAATTDLGQRRA